MNDFDFLILNILNKNEDSNLNVVLRKSGLTNINKLKKMVHREFVILEVNHKNNIVKLSEDDINLLQSFFDFLNYENRRFHWYFINREVFNKYRIEHGLPPVIDNKRNVTFKD